MRQLIHHSSARVLRIALALVLCSSLGFFPACSDDSTTTVNPPEPVVTVEITSPVNDDVFADGDDIDFAGTASDPEGTALTGAALVWTTDQGGDPLGTGETFTATVPLGERTIILTATDGDMRTGTDSVDISVVPPVTATIISPTPEGVYDEFTEIQLTGSAEDYLGNPLTGDSLVWRNRGVQVGTGESVLTLLPEGEQTVFLIATDGLGRFVIESVVITVGGDGVQFDLTGTWSFTTTAPVLQGTYFTQDEAMIGFCDIVTVGADMSLTFTDGYLECDPVWICAFTGTGISVTYNIGNSGQGDVEGETLTNAITLTAYSSSMLSGTQQSVYEHLDGVTTSSLFIHTLTLTKVK